MEKQIIVGIPTWCEADVIREHTMRVDRQLSACFPMDKKVLVNADNRSPDNTSSIFLETPTANPKVALLTDDGVKGKGYNFQKLFSYAFEEKADVLITLDADLETVPDDWLNELGQPILDGTTDLTIPLYPRFWYDGNLTNQIVAPLVLATTKIPIRQPIGGDYAFSRDCLELLLSTNWPRKALGFGIDIFVVMTSLKEHLRLKQAPLSTGKIHSWRSDTAEEVEAEMSDKFSEVVGTTLEELSLWKSDLELSRLPSFPVSPELGYGPKNYDFSHLEAAAEIGFRSQRQSKVFQLLSGSLIHQADSAPNIDDQSWGRILWACLNYARQRTLDTEFYEAFKALFFMRIAFVLPQLRNASIQSRKSIESRIIDVAETINCCSAD